MAIPELLKKAIVQMVPKEKDKLLLRLITKDPALCDKLYFELIEERSTIVERREMIAAQIEDSAQMPINTPGWVMMEMKSLSGAISYHVKITKDKLGAIELNLLLMNTFLDSFSDVLQKYTSRSDKCALYIAKKALTLISGLNKLDDDFRFDFVVDTNQMLQKVNECSAKNYARQLGVPSRID
jgi:hypothetical protein